MGRESTAVAVRGRRDKVNTHTPRRTSRRLGTEERTAGMTAEEIAARYVGAPYKHRGRGPDGYDCLGLLLAIYRDAGIKTGYADQEVYDADWHEIDPERYLRGLLIYGRPASPPWMPFDLVYFSIGGVVRHAGVMVNDRQFVHVLDGRSVTVSRLARYWERHLAGARRFV